MNKNIQNNFFSHYQGISFFDLLLHAKLFPFIAFCCIAILLWMPELILNMEPAVAAWSTFVFLIFLCMTAWRQVRSMGENPWVSPLFLYTAFVLTFQTALGLPFVWFGVKVAESVGFSPEGFALMTDPLPKASWLIIIGSLGTYIGLLFPVRWMTQWLPALKWNIDENRFPKLSSIVVPFVVFSFFLTIEEGILPASLQHLVLVFGQCGNVLFMAGIIQILNKAKHKRLWWIIAIALGATSASLIFYGARSAVLFPFIFFLWTYLAVRKRFNRKLIVSMVIIILFFSMTFPWLSMFKQGRAIREKLSITEAAQIASTALAGSDVTLFAAIFGILRTQTLAAGNILSFVQYYPERIPYLEGESALVTLTAIVPRFLYPEKPNAGYYINKLAFDIGMGHELSLETSRTFIDAITEFYINFGPYGVFFLSILQGIYLQSRYDWLIRRSELCLGFPVYAAGFIGSSSLWQVFVADSRNFIVWVIFLWFLSHCSKKRQAAIY